MKGGKTRIQRAMVLASGKLRFVKNVHRSSQSRASRPRHSTKIRRTTSLTKRKRSYSRGSLVGTAEKLIKGGSLLATGVGRGEQVWRAEHNAGRAIVEGIAQYAGFEDVGHSSQNWKFDRAVMAWVPFIATSAGIPLIHKVIGMIRKL